MSSPRIPPRPTSEWTAEVDDALSVLVAGPAPTEPRPRPESHILGVYAWHPELMRGWMPFSNHLRNSSLSDRVRELVIIRTTWLGFGEYEWAQHVRMSQAGGIFTAAEIAAIGAGPGPEWASVDDLVLRTVDELCGPGRNVTDATWAELETAFTRPEVLDLLFTVGTYDFHCTVFRALGLELEPGMTPFPADHLPKDPA